MARRKGLAPRLMDWVGADRLALVDAGTGWPSHFDCKTSSGVVRLAAHLGPIGLSQRGRDDVERRFQNPGKGSPVIAPAGEIPMLLGFIEHQGKRLLVGMDALKRVGKETRQSLFMPVQLLSAAAASHWAEHVSDSGERLIAFSAPLLPLFVEVYRRQASGSEVDIQSALVASGESLTPTAAGLERAMVVVAKLARDAAFSKRIRSA